MFIQTAYKCPIAKETKGLIEIEPEIIGKLAGAVLEPDEWLVILLGTKSQGGLHVIVEEIYVPPNQKRTRATCEVDGLPKNIKAYIVGALHSHNNMGAKFSGSYGDEGGDRGEGGLNMTYPLSIVISSSYSATDVEATLLGFDYEAELTADAPSPCGALIKCSANIIPRGIDDWPFKYQIVRPPANGIYKHLGDCSEYSETEDSTRYKYKRKADCGLKEKDFNLKGYIFGFDYESIVSQLPEAHNPLKKENGKSHKEVTMVPDYSRDKKDMDRWMSYDDYVEAYYGK